jgi:hypothetical protein
MAGGEESGAYHDRLVLGWALPSHSWGALAPPRRDGCMIELKFSAAARG